jgi:hypothetical protein
VAAFNVQAYDFRQGDIIAFRETASTTPGTRYYYVYNSNLTYQTQIEFAFHSILTNFMPRDAIHADGQNSRFWVAYANPSTNLAMRRYDSTTSWVDLASSITASNAWGITRAGDKFYITFSAVATLSTNYFTNRGGMGDVTMSVNKMVSYNFMNNTWGTPFMLLNNLGQVDGDATGIVDGKITTTTSMYKPAYLASSNEVWMCYGSGNVKAYRPESANPERWSHSGAGLGPANISNGRGMDSVSTSQVVNANYGLGTPIWNPYRVSDPNQTYVVMPLEQQFYNVLRLTSGQLLQGKYGTPKFYLCDPVTRNYTTNDVASGWTYGPFTQITWPPPPRGTIVTVR